MMTIEFWIDRGCHCRSCCFCLFVFVFWGYFLLCKDGMVGCSFELRFQLLLDHCSRSFSGWWRMTKYRSFRTVTIGKITKSPPLSPDCWTIFRIWRPCGGVWEVSNGLGESFWLSSFRFGGTKNHLDWRAVIDGFVQDDNFCVDTTVRIFDAL